MVFGPYHDLEYIKLATIIYMYIKMASSEPESIIHTYPKNVMTIVSILNITTKLAFVPTKLALYIAVIFIR